MGEKKSYPYTFARISAMKANLIPRQEYRKLIKMEVDSITRYLQDSSYKEEITKWSSKYSRLRLIDYALNENMRKTTEKLEKICDYSAKKILTSYLKRTYFQNIKVIIRGIYSNTKFEEIEPLIVPTGKMTTEYYKGLYNLGSIEKVLSKVKVLRQIEAKEVIEEFNRSLKLIDVENKLDKILYKSQLYKAKKLSEDGKSYEKFIRTEIDIANIRNILRLKKENVPVDEIRNYMLPGGIHIRQEKLNKMITVSIDEVYNELNNSYYGNKIKFNSKESMLDLELELEKYLTRSSYIKSSSNPLGIICIVSYLMMKMNEIKNIRKIVKAKHFGLDNDFIEEKLIIS